MKNEQDMAAFEAAMKKNCYATPIRGRVREYASGGDQALYDGWRMAMEANGDERELCARVCDDLREKTLSAQSGPTNALENVMLRQVAELGFGEAAAAIRARGAQ